MPQIKVVIENDNLKKLHQADLFINSSVVELSHEDDRAFSEFLKNKKKDLVNVR
jgi:hypothetical protein